MANVATIVLLFFIINIIYNFDKYYIDMDLPQRKLNRMSLHDYNGGDYFVTICTKEHKHHFGDIVNAEIIYSDIGHIAEREIKALPAHLKFVDVLNFVVMPNHIHIIIRIIPEKNASPKNYKRSLLDIAIGYFKQRVSYHAKNKDFQWQRSYHDRIIRTSGEATMISKYISGNVANWENDCFYGLHQSL